jgi:hypothetical protein
MKIEGTNVKGNKEYTTILDAVGDCCVFHIDKNDDGTFTMTEGCDGYYRVELSKDQLIQLGNELIAFANQ